MSNRILCFWKSIFLLGTLALLAAFFTATGLAFVIPKQAVSANWHYIADASMLPDDGTPFRLRLWQVERDAWALRHVRLSNEVFVRRKPATGEIQAFPDWHEFNGMRIRVVYLEKRKMFHST